MHNWSHQIRSYRYITFFACCIALILSFSVNNLVHRVEGRISSGTITRIIVTYTPQPGEAVNGNMATSLHVVQSRITRNIVDPRGINAVISALNAAPTRSAGSNIEDSMVTCAMDPEHHMPLLHLVLTRQPKDTISISSLPGQPCILSMKTRASLVYFYNSIYTVLAQWASPGSTYCLDAATECYGHG